MIVRTLKLRPTKCQVKEMERWLFSLTSVYNWTSRKIELNLRDGIEFSEFDLKEMVNGHGKRIGIGQHVVQATVAQAVLAWERHRKGLSRKPHLKGNRNRLNSIPFRDPIKPPVGNRISLPIIGSLRVHRQEIPEAKIKCGRILKRASGWYLALWLDTDHKFPVKDTDSVIGIDPGFSTLLTLSNGTKIENPRELSKGAKRLAQAQRGKRKKLTARLQERVANIRKDRNHKISRRLVEDHKTIFFSDDNFRSMARRFGKSVSEAGLGELKTMISYKSSTCDRNFIKVNSRNTTMTCSTCGALTGPTGLDGLAVRNWECSACGAHHDRDINAAMVVLSSGLGTSHYIQELLKTG